MLLEAYVITYLKTYMHIYFNSHQILSPPLDKKHDELDSAEDNRSYRRCVGAIARVEVEVSSCKPKSIDSR